MQLAIISMINKLIAAAAVAVAAILLLLPETPFKFEAEIDTTWVGYMNYVLPIEGIITHMTLYLTAVITYYVVRYILRWLKFID